MGGGRIGKRVASIGTTGRPRAAWRCVTCGAKDAIRSFQAMDRSAVRRAAITAHHEVSPHCVGDLEIAMIDATTVAAAQKMAVQ